MVERTLKQELQGKETGGKRDQRKFYYHTLLHHQAVLHILLIPPLSLHLLLIIIIILLHLLNLLILLQVFLEGLHALPSLLQGPVGQALGMTAYRSGLHLPNVKKKIQF